MPLPSVKIRPYPPFVRWRLRPEIAGDMGPRTVLDASTHPPRVSRLHYEFSGWAGADLVESFPCFLVTERLATAIQDSGLTGGELEDVEVTFDPQFAALLPDVAALVPRSWRWLRPQGGDFALEADATLVVSEAALSLLQGFCLAECEVTASSE